MVALIPSRVPTVDPDGQVNSPVSRALAILAASVMAVDPVVCDEILCDHDVAFFDAALSCHSTEREQSGICALFSDLLDASNLSWNDLCEWFELPEWLISGVPAPDKPGSDHWMKAVHLMELELLAQAPGLLVHEVERDPEIAERLAAVDVQEQDTFEVRRRAGVFIARLAAILETEVPELPAWLVVEPNAGAGVEWLASEWTRQVYQ